MMTPVNSPDDIAEGPRSVESLLTTEDSNILFKLLIELEGQPVSDNFLIVVRMLAFHPNEFVRDKAASLLGYSDLDEDLFRLCYLARDKHWTIRCTVAETLGDSNKPGARKELMRILATDHHPVVRFYGIIGLLKQPLSDEEKHFLEHKLERTHHFETNSGCAVHWDLPDRLSTS